MFPITEITPGVLFLINMILGITITCLITPAVLKMVRQSGFVRPNFKGDLIPAGVGFIFLLVFLTVITFDYLLVPGLLGDAGMISLMGLSVITLLGLMDDTLGSREASGLKGHFKALLKGQLTTGALKALGGGALAVLITLAYCRLELYMQASFIDIIVNTLVIALSINAINLLDLRPGRAGKGFLLLALIIAAFSWGDTNILPLALIAGSVIAYLSWDLKARAMMGDAGSNALGLTIGMTAAWSLDEVPKLTYLVFLILFHLFTEKYSLTTVIANNRFLDYLDKLGRR